MLQSALSASAAKLGTASCCRGNSRPRPLGPTLPPPALASDPGVGCAGLLSSQLLAHRMGWTIATQFLTVPMPPSPASSSALCWCCEGRTWCAHAVWRVCAGSPVCPALCGAPPARLWPGWALVPTFNGESISTHRSGSCCCHFGHAGGMVPSEPSSPGTGSGDMLGSPRP